MKVADRHYHTIWLNNDGRSVDIIDQRWLPHEFKVVTLETVDDVAIAIRDMWVRGAPLIGVTAAYGVAIAMAEDPSDAALHDVWDKLHETRPTAINLRWALDTMHQYLLPLPEKDRMAAAYRRAADIAEEDVQLNRQIGLHGLEIIRGIAARKSRASRSIFSPIAMQAGSQPLTTAQQPLLSTLRRRRGSTFMSMLMRHVRATRARN